MHLNQKNKIKLNFFYILFITLSLIAFFINSYSYTSGNHFFFTVVRDSIFYLDLYETRYNQDSQNYFHVIYILLSKYIYFEDFKIKINNDFGILLYIHLFRSKIYLIYIFQLCICIVVINQIIKFIIINWLNVCILLISLIFLINCISFPNKEVLTFISITNVLTYFFKREKIFIFFALIFSFFSRGEFFIFNIIFITYILFINNFDNQIKSKLIYIPVIAILIIISIYYKEISDKGIAILESFQTEKSLGISMAIHNLNLNYNLHFITIILKIFGNFYGGLIKPLEIIDLHHLLIYFDQLVFFFLTTNILFFKRKSFKNIIVNEYFIYFLCICILFSSSVFLHHRYISPVIIILIIILFQRPNKVQC